jgi:hypothetical protein
LGAALSASAPRIDAPLSKTRLAGAAVGQHFFRRQTHWLGSSSREKRSCSSNHYLSEHRTISKSCRSSKWFRIRQMIYSSINIARQTIILCANRLPGSAHLDSRLGLQLSIRILEESSCP